MQATDRCIMAGQFLGRFLNRGGDKALLAACRRFHKQDDAIRRIYDQHKRTDPPEELLKAMFAAWGDALTEVAETNASTAAGIKAKSLAMMRAMPTSGAAGLEDLLRSLCADIATVI